jgi:hypothetical protein
MKSKQKRLSSDYNFFLKNENTPFENKHFLHKQIQRRLFPSPAKVLVKILGVHLFVGTLSLSVCDQFGLNPFGTSQFLTSWFMSWGHSFCMILCGGFFASATFLISQLLLSFEEVETLQRSRFTQIAAIMLLSLGTFFFLGADFVGSLVLLWSLGALVGGISSIFGSLYLRRAFIQ